MCLSLFSYYGFVGRVSIKEIFIISVLGLIITIFIFNIQSLIPNIFLHSIFLTNETEHDKISLDLHSGFIVGILAGIFVVIFTVMLQSIHHILKHMKEVENIRDTTTSFYGVGNTQFMKDECKIIGTPSIRYPIMLKSLSKSVQSFSLPIREKSKLITCIEYELKKMEDYSQKETNIEADYRFWEFLVRCDYLTQEEFNSIRAKYKLCSN